MPTGALPTGTRGAVSSAHGALRHLLLCFPQEAALLRGYRLAYADLLAQLPDRARLTVLVHPQAADVFDALLAASPRADAVTVVPAPAALRFTVWAQDPCLVTQDGAGGTCLVTPFFFDREQDSHVADVVAAATGARLVRSSLCFHGGYVLLGDDFMLVSRACRDATLRTRERVAGDPVPAEAHRDTVAAELFRDVIDPARDVVFVGAERPLPAQRTRPLSLAGRELLEILPGGGDGPHPLGHLDMFVTLAGRGRSGRYRLLVGSPAVADAILGRAPVECGLAEHFDDVAEQLAGCGFEVLRNPLPLTYADGRRTVDGNDRDVRLWYFATANNCIVQIDPEEGDHVWLPTYGHGAWRELVATDAENRRIWEELGFTVHELTSFHAFAQRFGALHCIVKELARAPVGDQLATRALA